MDTSQLTVIVWTHRNMSLLRNTLRSMKAHTNPGYRVIVQVNEASDDSIDRVSRIISEEKVHGHALFFDGKDPSDNANVVVKHVKTMYCCICHDDVVFVPGIDDFWERMLWPTADPLVGLVGPVSNIGDGYQGFMRTEAPEYVKAHNIHTPITMFRTGFFNSMGGHDTNIKMGTAIDLSIRAHLAGFDLVVARNAYIHHVGGASWGKLDRDQEKYNDFLADTTNDFEDLLIRKFGLRVYYEYINRSNEWEQILRMYGDSGFEAITKRLSVKPEEWKPGHGLHYGSRSAGGMGRRTSPSWN